MAPKHALLLLAASAALAVTPPASAEDNGPQPPAPCASPYGPGAPTSPTGTTVTLPTSYPMPVGTVPAPGGNPYSPTMTTYVCVNGTWYGVTTFLEAGLVLAADTASVEVAEGSTATVTGTYSYAGDDPVTLTASAGHATALGDGTWAWSMTPYDGPAIETVTISGTAGDATGSVAFDLDVTNVAPTITSLVPDSPFALVGQTVTFTGTATDPSDADTAAGFTWSDLTDVVEACGSRTISATATDKDGGVSAPVVSAPVEAVEAAFAAPLTAGARNIVRAGQVVPVRVTVGCDGSSVAGLAPAIRLLTGDVDPATTSDDPALPAPTTDATGDTSGLMREVAGSYLYNLRVPEGSSGSLFTVQVRPIDSAGSINLVLELR